MGVTLARIRDPDFAEGIRAAVVDKDRAPVWRPATLAETDESEIRRHFADLGERELGLSSSVFAIAGRLQEG